MKHRYVTLPHRKTTWLHPEHLHSHARIKIRRVRACLPGHNIHGAGEARVIARSIRHGVGQSISTSGVYIHRATHAYRTRQIAVPLHHGLPHQGPPTRRPATA